MTSTRPPIAISELANSLGVFKDEFEAAKARAASPGFPWYPYDSLSNFIWMDRLLTGARRDIGSLVGDLPILDVGCADGASSFYLEKAGFKVEVIDHPLTSNNDMQGVRLLKSALKSKITIHKINLDEQFVLPRRRYGLVLFLGLLYHLRNPFYVLETLSKRAKYCVLSTRIARFAPGRERLLEDLPVAYLVAPYETNNDATNFWIFSKAGLERLVFRAGWYVRDYISVGNVENSDPATPEGDERAFCFLESHRILSEPVPTWWNSFIRR